MSMLTEHESWMRLALELAEKAAVTDEVPVGAILVINQEVLGEGFNRREFTQRVTAHAEILALEQYHDRFRQWRLPPQTCLYVTAEPCLMCTGALLQARIDKIFFGCSDPRSAGLGTVRDCIEKGVFDHRPSVMQGGILDGDCAAVLSRFFRKKRQENP